MSGQKISRCSCRIVIYIQFSMMIPSSRYSHHHPLPFDLNLNEEEHHHFFTTTNSQLSSSTSSSLSSSSYPDQPLGSYSFWDQQPNHFHLAHQQAEKIDTPSSGGSLDHREEEEKDGNRKSSKLIKLKILKKEDRNNENHLENQAHHGSVKWMSSTMRIMDGSDEDTNNNNNFRLGFDEEAPKQQPPLSPLGTDNSSSNNNSSSKHDNNMSVRVCSDCHTTKTPLWRSGPRGPKSLCNACGIRQRKARRAAMAAAAEVAASTNDTTLMANTDDGSDHHGMKKEKKLHKHNNNKDTKLKGKCISAQNQLKKKRNYNKSKASHHHNRGRNNNKVGFDELTISLSKNLELKEVFPHDEKEAAILLMALSYGLLHGFPSHRYLD